MNSVVKTEKNITHPSGGNLCLTEYDFLLFILFKGSDGLMDNVSASQPRDRGFEPNTGHDHDSSYDTSTGWFQETDSIVI